MEKIYCKVNCKYHSYNGKEGYLLEGKEIERKHGVKRMFVSFDGYKLYDNYDEWTITNKSNLENILHLNPYSKPRKPQIIKGDNFLFIG